jgi:hypothetical protein
MDIVNKTDIDVSWFCYNSYDGFEGIALASGDLSANGGGYAYQPPNNATGLYFVRFTQKGGGIKYAGGYIKKSGQIDLIRNLGFYEVSIRFNN